MERLHRILKELGPVKREIDGKLSLKADLGFDSILLIQLATRINREFRVDLGELADQGQRLEFVEDLEKCLAGK